MTLSVVAGSCWSSVRFANALACRERRHRVAAARVAILLRRDPVDVAVDDLRRSAA